MKKPFTLIFIFSAIALFAQIPNAGFEVWSNGQPTGWATSNVLYDTSTSVTQSSNAHSGLSAAKLITLPGGDAGGSIYTGDTDGHYGEFPIPVAPQSLSFWYIGTFMQNDFLMVTANILNGHTGVASLLQTVNTNTSVYKQVVLNYGYVGTPVSTDSGAINLTIQSGSPSGPFVGSTVTVDDMSFEGTTAINEIRTGASLEECLPNPASTSANIIYSIDRDAVVSLYVYDIMGNKVKTLLSSEQQSSGRYKVPIDVSNMPGGVYFSCLNANGETITRKLIVAR